MGENKAENRMFRRLNVECTAKVKINEEEFPMQIVNISGQGIRFWTQKALKPSERVTIIVSMASTPDPMVLTGVVAWAKNFEDGQNEVGIKLHLTSWSKMSQVLGRK